MVSEHCTRDVVVCLPSETLPQAARRMRESHVGDLVVVDDLTNRVPVGLITDRDIVVGPVAQATEQIGALTVGDVMTTPPITVRESESLDTVLTKMAHQGVRRVPVLDTAGVLTGVLAVDDVLGHVTGELGKLVSLLAHEAEREVARRPSAMVDTETAVRS